MSARRAIAFVLSVVGPLLTGCSSRTAGSPTTTSGATTRAVVFDDAPPLIASGDSFTCVVRGAGSVACFGPDTWKAPTLPGGDPDIGPFAIAGVEDAAAVYAVGRYGCALRKSGQVSCFGDNTNNMASLQAPTFSTMATATPVVGVANVKRLALGASRACAVEVDGSVTCWGRDASVSQAFGAHASLAPAKLAGVTGATDVAVGDSFVCTLASGAVTCTGKDAPAFTSKDVRAIAAFGGWAAALRETGDIVVAGIVAGFEGPNITEQPLPEMSPAVRIHGGTRLCAVMADHRARCFVTMGGAEVDDLGATDAAQVAAGGAQSCVRGMTGGVTCRGSVSALPVAGAPGNIIRRAPQPAGGVTDAVWIAANGARTCVVRRDGTVACWGAHATPDVGDSATAAPIAGVAGAKEAAVSASIACTVGAAGRPICWGPSEALGRNMFDLASAALPGIDGAEQVAVSDSGAALCFLIRGGAVDCRGLVVAGTAHEYDTAPITLPVHGIAAASRVVTSDYGGCAVVAGGAVDCWRFERVDITKRDPPSSQRIAGVSAVLAIDQLNGTFYALTEGGDIFTWDVLIDGTITKSARFDHIAKATDLAAAEGRLFVIADGGKVLAYDRGNYLLADDGSFSGPQKPPHEVPGIADAVQVAPASQHVCVRQKAGGVLCWGLSTDGRLDDGTMVRDQIAKLTPIRAL